MNGIEALQAMKDGKVVEVTYRGGGEDLLKWSPGLFIHRWDDGKGEWIATDVHASMFINDRATFELVKEYHLTFVEAMDAMLKGKRVTNELCPMLEYYIESKVLLCDNEDCKRLLANIDLEEQNGMWKVVE